MLPRQVRDLMSPGVTTLRVTETLDLANQIMKLARIRHMPVLDAKGELVGVISQRDLFHSALARSIGIGNEANLELLRGLAVEDVMGGEPVTTTSDTPLRDAARLMRERAIGCLPVLDGGKLVGILTEADFVKFFAERDD